MATGVALAGLAVGVPFPPLAGDAVATRARRTLLLEGAGAAEDCGAVSGAAAAGAGCSRAVVAGPFCGVGGMTSSSIGAGASSAATGTGARGVASGTDASCAATGTDASCVATGPDAPGVALETDARGVGAPSLAPHSLRNLVLQPFRRQLAALSILCNGLSLIADIDS